MPLLETFLEINLSKVVNVIAYQKILVNPRAFRANLILKNRQYHKQRRLLNKMNGPFLKWIFLGMNSLNSSTWIIFLFLNALLESNGFIAIHILFFCYQSLT